MNDTTARTILSLDKRRQVAEQERHAALLELAETRHEILQLRHMRSELLQVLTSYRRGGPRTAGRAKHFVATIERVIRSTTDAQPTPPAHHQEGLQP